MDMTTSKEIDATAADWAARIDRGPMSEGEERALALWIDADARHRGAFMRMRAIALQSERARALGPNFNPEAILSTGLHPKGRTTFPAESSGRSRPATSAKYWAAAAAAACVAIVIALRFIGNSQGYDTRLGEVKVVPLADGSVMTLNTASRAEVAFDGKRRRIRLFEGEALFDVAQDKARPFIVEAGAASVRAIGTSFTVQRLLDKPVQVIVREGVVEVQQASAQSPIRVAANMRAEVVTHPEGVGFEPMPMLPDAVNREFAWRDGRIAFEAETLAQAAAAFARYSPTRIVIEDPTVANRQITGLFTANDPVSFAKAAASSLDLKAQVRDGEVRLSR